MPPQDPSSDNLRLRRKRKDVPTPSPREKKRTKIQDHRVIKNQATELAFADGELNVEKFVRAREYEIKALEEGLKNSRHGLATRAFQEVPRDMRRRTASHNVKKIPKRVRARARREMVEDNTPTVTARRRKPTSHQRLRLETAKRLQKLSAKSKKRRQEKREKAKENVVAISPVNELVTEQNTVTSGLKPRKAKAKKSKLRTPDTPPSKFRKRQIHKTWLPTHIYHAKRATMTPPKEPLWRFALPLSPANKVYRITHRASTVRGAVAWDTSYVSTIGLQGPEKSIEGLLKALGVGCDSDREGVWKVHGSKWRKGSRTWEGWLYERQRWPSAAITPATVIWNPTEERLTNASTAGESLDDNHVGKLNQKSSRRQAFIRVHPAGFLRLWDQVVRVAKVQKPMVAVEDLRFEIGSIEIVGPNSTETLTGTLRPAPVLPKDPGSQRRVVFEMGFTQLGAVADASALPPNVVIAFEANDPRLHFPISKIDNATHVSRLEDCLDFLANWPFDHDAPAASIFSRNERLKAKRTLSSQQSINRRKAAATPGSLPEPRATDPRIPVLLYTSKRQSSKQTTWTILLPWKTVLPVWLCLMRYPLSCGGVPRFVGLTEKRQLDFETGTPWFPGDYPGTKAGDEWEAQERDRRKKEWERKPKGRRIEYTSVNLGNGQKGEIGLGWACDWDLLREQQASSVPERNVDNENVEMRDAPTMTTLYHLSTPFARRLLSQNAPHLSPADPALMTVRLTMLARGVPKICARIYRLPTNDPDLRKQWLAQRPLPKSKQAPKHNATLRAPPKNASGDTFRSYLAASILSESRVTPGGEGYPYVPDQKDLIGFVTTGNYNLGEGMGTGIGSVMVAKVLPLVRELAERRLCIVRDAGESFGRLARWELV